MIFHNIIVFLLYFWSNAAIGDLIDLKLHKYIMRHDTNSPKNRQIQHWHGAE